MSKKNQPRKPISAPKPTVAAASSKSSATRRTDAALATDANAKTWPWLAAVLGITAAIMWKVTHNGFVNWDDYPYLIENELVLKPFSIANVIAILKQTLNGNWNPLPIVMYHIEYQFVKLEPWLYHFNNWWLHLVCVALVFALVRRLGLNLLSASIVALLFGIHPMRVESVAWVTERKDVLFGAFYLGALLLYVKQIQNPMPKTRFWIFMVALFGLSLISKIQAVSLPLSMLCIDYFLGRKLGIHLIIEKAVYFLMSLGVGLLGVYFLKDQGSLGNQVTNFNLFERLLIGAYSYCVYIVKWIWPYQMSPLYPYPDKLDSMFYVAPLGVLAVLGLMWWAWKKEYKAIVFGVAFFTVNVMFLLQIVGAGQGFIADRFTYMGYLGLFFIAGYFAQQLFESNVNARPAIIGISVLYFAASAYMSVQQIGIWKDGEKLWSHVLKYYDKVTTPYNNRGEVLRKRGEDDLALADYNKSIALKPNAPALNSRGMIYFNKNRVPDAIKDYELALTLDTATSMQAEVRINMGGALGFSRRFAEAKTFLDQGLKLEPDNQLGYKNRYLVHLDLGMFDKALADVNKYLEINPNEASSWVDRGAILKNMNRYNEALESINKGIGMASPTASNLGLFYLNRAMVYALLGNRDAQLKDVAEAQKRGTAIPPELLK